MIKISKSNGIFSKIKKAFIHSEVSPITNDSFEIDDSVPASSTESNTSISSSTENQVSIDDSLSSSNLASPKSENNTEKDFISTPVENHSEISAIDNNANYWSILNTGESNYYTTGKRKLLFKVDKYKFDYPIPKSTTLYYYPNLPIIQSLEYTTKTKHDNTSNTTILCNNVQVTIPIEYEYDEITFKPYISYSVALYNKKTPCLLESTDSAECDLDINNLDIYALENDALFLTPFTMCFPAPAKNFSPSDFIVTVSITDPLGGTVSPVAVFDNYYLYEVEVSIELTLAPVVNLSNIDINTLNVLNAQLDKPIGNTLFTECELESVTSIDFSGFATIGYSTFSVSELDYNIFDYLPNLINLNISNTNASVNASSNFIHLNNLNKLTTLIAENNYFSDYAAFSLLTNLIDRLANLNLDNYSYEENTLDRYTRVLAQSSIDISPLTIFTNLITLNLSGNNLITLPTSIGNLSNLTSLNLSHNSLINLPPEFSALNKLVNLDLSVNNISDLSVLSNFNNLEILNVSGNQLDPSTIENLPVTELDYSNSNLDNNSLSLLKLSSKLRKLNISGNHISDLTSLSQYSIDIIAINQIVDYGKLEPLGSDTYYLDLETFLLDIDGYVPCIDYISDGGSCDPLESCDCVTITWSGITTLTNAYLTFSNITDTFTGKVTIELTPLPV